MKNAKTMLPLMILALAATAAFLGISHAAEEAVSPDEQSMSAPESTGGTPRIAFEEEEYDFGTIAPQQSVKHIFKFRNNGDALLIVEKVRATCGCTGTLLSQKEIAPGGEGTIEVTFKAGLSGGKTQKSIYVHSNDPEQPAAQLRIKAYIVVPVEAKPRSLYWVVDKNKPSTRLVQLIHQPDIKMNIIDITSSSPDFTASASPKADAETPTYSIEITCNGNLPMGNFREKMEIHTDNPDYPTLTVSIRGNVTGTVRVTPNAVALGVIKDGTIPERIIRVYAVDKEDFEIKSVEPSSTIIKATVTKENDTNRYLIDVTLTESPSPGAFSEKLIIKTNVPEEDTLEVPVYAYVR